METIAPTRCVVCDVPGEVLCASCANALPHIDPSLACPRCGAPYGHAQCTECPLPGSEEALAHPERAFPFAAARAALSFEDGARRLVRTYKDGDELRLAPVIASLLCATMRGRVVAAPSLSHGSRVFCDSLAAEAQNGPESPDLAGSWGKAGAFDPSEGPKRLKNAKNVQAAPVLDDWTQWADALVAIPASPEAVLRRGFDHMERIAGICGARTGLPVLPLLDCKKGARDQRELGRDERQANRTALFGVRRDGATALPGRVILLDDVFTTGATLSAATQVLLGAGVDEVRVVVCARVW